MYYLVYFVSISLMTKKTRTKKTRTRNERKFLNEREREKNQYNYSILTISTIENTNIIK